MRRFFAILAFAACAVPLSAAEWSGTLVDVMCKGKDLASHTRKCALDCAKSGFAVVTSDGAFYKFDETGNTKALEMLRDSKKDKDLKAKVTGNLSDGVIQVETLALEP